MPNLRNNFLSVSQLGVKNDLIIKSIVTFLIFFCLASSVKASQLYVGTSSVEITPPLPVALSGQRALRVADTAQTPITANIVILENREKGDSIISTIFISVDLILVTEELKSKVRSKVKGVVPEIDPDKIIMNATHIHSGPAIRHGLWVSPDEDVTTSYETVEFVSDKISEGIQKAWQNIVPGSMTWGLGHAALAINRRATYSDGSARMYGDTNSAEFRGLEGPQPNDVNILFFWNEEDQLIGAYINVPCPAQTVEHRTAINADYWHPVRQSLKVTFGNQLVILGSIGAAGDQSPHEMINDASERRMRELRGIDRLEQLARRVVASVKDVYDAVKTDRHKEINIAYESEVLQLPERLVNREAYEKAIKNLEELQSSDKEHKIKYQRWGVKNKAIINRYERQHTQKINNYSTRINVVRLGDIVIATNQFELFTEFGTRIQARSRALQTFIVQLAGPGTYVPTQEATEGGGYSADFVADHVGPVAGQILVDRTVELINDMWTQDE